MAVQLTRWRFTVDDYYAMAAAGILREDDRVELIDGEIIEMPPIGPGHANVVDRITLLLVRRLGDRAQIRSQNPIRLDQLNEPQPDFALLRLRPDGYGSTHPTPEDVLLVIEVSDTTLATDRDVKMPLYARFGIREGWIVDVQHQVVAIHREPTPRGYQLVTPMRHGDTVRPLAFPDIEIAVDDLLD
jgi:Uma2 family endonuclease